MLVSGPESPPVVGAPSLEALKLTLKPPLVGVLWPAAVATLGLAIFYNTYPRHLQEIGAQPGALGLIFNLGVVAEIILMPFTGRLIQRIGAERIVLGAILAIAMRTLLLCVSDSLLVAVLTQLLHGPIVVGLFVTLPIILRERAEEGTRYSLQGIQTFLFMGVARSLGPWLASAALLIGVGGMGSRLDLAFLLAACFAIAGYGLSVFLRSNEKR
jgi:MFS family permease